MAIPSSSPSPPAVTASRAMGPSPQSLGAMFIQNQFRTSIPVPGPSTDLAHQTAIVTGANSGMGFECCKLLLAAGLSRLVMAVRSPERGDEAAARLRSLFPASAASIEVWQLDMESYESIQAFARRCDELLDRIEYVVLNAGLASLPFRLSPATGHEVDVQVNYLGTLLLAILLLPILKAKGRRQSTAHTSTGETGSPSATTTKTSPSATTAHRAPRLTIVSSLTARHAKLPNRDARPLLPSFDTPAAAESSPGSTSWSVSQDRYGTSKLLTQMAVERIASDCLSPRDVVLSLVEPGLTRATGLGRDLGGGCVVKGLVGGAMRLVARDPVQGAATYYDALVGQGDESHGCFVMNCQVASYADFMYRPEARRFADDLWDETMDELAFARPREILDGMRRARVGGEGS